MESSATVTAARAGSVRFGDLSVNRLGFGAMRITGEGVWGEPADVDEARRVLRRALELEVQLIDTADSYGPEVSERLIAETLHPYPADLVIATKGGLTRSGPGRWERNCRPDHLRQACEASLRRLRLERVDVYQLHAVDPEVPLEESVGALAELREEGKVRHVGLSNVTVDQLERALEIVPVVSVQNRYSVVDRDADDVVDRCEELGLAFLPWFPLGAGSLDGRGDAIAEVADRHGASAHQVAIAWLLARSPTVAPIPGTSSVAHLADNVAAAALDLDDGDLELLG
jgi:aryl-alcohol dehydrogenase-like predicted oxidoreductase